MILAGDIGGTYARLALLDDQLQVLVASTYATQGADSLESLVATFLAEQGTTVDRAAFGVAGAVRDGRCSETTNLPWPVEGRSVAAAVGLERAVLVNDVEASAHALALLGDDDLAVVNPGLRGATGNVALISIGTGLGLACAFWDGSAHHVFATEGGYVDFAARTELEEGLRRSLATNGTHVSYERVCSGEGLTNIHRLLSGGETREPREIVERAEAGDETATEAVDAMVAICGAFAGNMAISLAASGGVYVAGGIARALLPRLQSAAFLDSFLDKGLLRGVLERTPVHVVVNEQLGILGAATLAP